MQQQYRMQKPLKMFIYLPLYLLEKKPGRPPAEGVQPVHVRTVIKEMPFSRVEPGDIFLIDKINSSDDVLGTKGNMKAEQVKRSVIDGSCLVVLEKKVFNTKQEVENFLQGKKSIK